MESEQLQRAIEAILFAAGERIDIARLAAALETDASDVERLPTIWRINMPLSAGESAFSSWKRATRWCPPGRWRTM